MSISVTPFTSEPRAIIRGQTLVLTLQDAVNPVVWQMDLAHVRAAALAVVAQGDHWQLRCKTNDGNAQDVALYHNRDKAVAVLELVHLTLAGNDRTTVPSNPLHARHVILALTAIALLVVLNVILMRMVPPPNQAATVPPGTPSSPSIGVPQNADDVLQDRGPRP